MQDIDILGTNTDSEPDDAIRISTNDFRKTYDEACCVWSSLHAVAAEYTSAVCRSPQRVPSEDNLADVLTKPLGTVAFKSFVSRLVRNEN